MEPQRTKRIRTGAIVIVVTLVLMAVAVMSSKDLRLELGLPLGGGGSWLDFRVIGFGDKNADPGKLWEYRQFRLKDVLALGLIAVGVGAILVVTGLTKPRQQG
jgi:hypothetical protein